MQDAWHVLMTHKKVSNFRWNQTLSEAKHTPDTNAIFSDLSCDFNITY